MSPSPTTTPRASTSEKNVAIWRIRKTIVRRAAGLVLGLSLAGAVTGAGQAPPGLREVRSWGTGGLGLVVGLPVGQFRSFVDVAGGVAGSFAVNLDGRGAVALRFDGAYLQYGNEDRPLALAGGGGLLIDLSRGRHPVSLDLGASYVRNGQVSYLREGSIVENPDGSFTLQPVRSDANLVVLQAGVSIGLR